MAEGAASVVRAALLPDDGPTGGFYRDGRPLPLVGQLHCVHRLMLEDWTELPDYTRNLRAERA